MIPFFRFRGPMGWIVALWYLARAVFSCAR